MFSIKDRRIGKFRVTFDAIDCGKVAEVFAKMNFVALRAEAIFYDGVIEYVGISPIFEELPRGMVIPDYDITVNDLGKEITVGAKKRQ